MPLEVRVVASEDFLWELNYPVLNAAGELAFRAFTPQGYALFGPDEFGQPTLIASEFSGQPIPGMPPGTRFQFVDFLGGGLTGETHFPQIADNGEVAFKATLRGPQIEDPDFGVWRWSPGTGFELVSRNGDSVPEAGPGTVINGIVGAEWNPFIGPGGAIGFFGSFGGPQFPAIGTGCFVAEDDEAVMVAGTGTPVPQLPGVSFSFSSALVAYGANRLGQWVVSAHLSGPGVVPGHNDIAGFLWDPDTGLSLRVRSGDPAPFTPNGVVFWRPIPYLGDAGAVAYETRLAGPNVTEANDTALYAPDASGSLVLLGREGGAAPGTEPGTTFGHFFSPDSALVNAAGQVAFRTALAGPAVTEANDRGIWLYDPATSALTLIAREGDPAPELPGRTFGALLEPVLNNAGDLVFNALLAGGPPAEYAIFARRGGSDLRVVVHDGDLVAVTPGDLRQVSYPQILSGVSTEMPGASPLNDSGQLAILVQLGPQGEERTGIVVATLPEPDLQVGLLCGIASLAWLRRRTTMARWRRSPRTSCIASRPSTAPPTTSTTPS